MSTASETGASGRRRSSRRSSVLTGVLVATLLVAISVVGRASGHDAGTTSHLWEHFKGLKVAGTINADTNPVHWTKLKGVPAGLADGVDDGVTVAGFGLIRIFGAFLVDPTRVQKRVTTACPSGQALRSISQEGTGVCTPVNQALAATDDDTGIICNDWCTEGSLMLAPGTWVITAKIHVRQADLNEERLRASCRLHAATVFDESTVDVEGLLPNVTLPMQIAATVSTGDGAYLDCRDHDIGNAMGHELSIIAMRVGG